MKLFEHHYQTFVTELPSIKDAVPVDVTEVGEWYYKEAEIPVIDFRGDFPTLVSPWEMAVYEYRFPSYFRSLNTETQKWENLPFVNLAGRNCLCIVTQEKMDGIDGLPDAEKKMLAQAAEKYPGEETKFRQAILLFAGDKREMRPMAQALLHLNAEGRCYCMGIDSLVKQNQEAVVTAVRNILYPIYFAINLMHCRNVRTVDSEINHKVAQNRKKAGKGCFAWKKIVIDSMRKSARTAAAAGKGNSVNLALRIARGHWKDYTNGKGLFGKLHGRFWWDDVASGELGRAYAVKPPEEVTL